MQAEFMHTCEAGAGGKQSAVTPCRCALSYLEARISERTLGATERAIYNGEAKVPKWLRDAVDACKPKK